MTKIRVIISFTIFRVHFNWVICNYHIVSKVHICQVSVAEESDASMFVWNFKILHILQLFHSHFYKLIKRRLSSVPILWLGWHKGSLWWLFQYNVHHAILTISIDFVILKWLTVVNKNFALIDSGKVISF